MQWYPPTIQVTYRIAYAVEEEESDYMEISKVAVTGGPAGCLVQARITSVYGTSTYAQVNCNEGASQSNYIDSGNTLDSVAAPYYALKVYYRNSNGVLEIINSRILDTYGTFTWTISTNGVGDPLPDLIW